MGATLTNLSGSGKIEDNSLISFSYSEDVTSLEPSDLTGGVGQVTFSGIVVKDEVLGNTRPASKFLINNTLLLNDENYGSVTFQVKSASVGNQVVNGTGNTIHERLNVDVTAGPHGGTGSTLWTAILYYCSLVDIVPSISSSLQTDLDAIAVNFIGWQGNLWEHLKMLCAGVSIDASDNVGLEMFINNNTLTFREAYTQATDVSDYIEEINLAIDSSDSSKSFEVTQYVTSYGVNKVIRQEERQDLTGATENVTISDTMQVDAGETLVKRFKINASLESIKQPVAVSEISIIPFPETASDGEYVIVGSDDLPIDPQQWEDQGGSLTVSITENPNEIELVIVAPPAPSLPLADDPTELTLAPYKIGVESSGEAEYPALYIVGTGVFFEKKTKTFLTGADDDFTSKESSTSIDNPFITTANNLASRGVAAAQANCGPNISLNISVSEGVAFGSTIGGVIKHESAKYRITGIQFSDSGASITAVGCTKFSDFQSTWGNSATIANFNAVVLDPTTYPDDSLSFNEFSVSPLIRSA